VNPEQLLERLRRLTSMLTPTQLATLAVAFVGVVGVVVGSAYYVNQPTYSLLFSELDAESAAAVVTRLKSAKVPYLLEDGGRTVRVASDRADELRLEFAGQGQPTSGRIGFEIFDRTAFGTTEFLEHVNYRRALEGELARTISTIAEVASARVHIAMAKDSLFIGDAQPAKASVVLKLRSSRPPAPAMVAGIAGLVSASVESLRPESVIIVDTNGRSLAHPQGGGDDGGGGVPLDRQQKFERDLATKVVVLLEPVVGSGHVRVNVSARLNGGSEETTEERWDPASVLRSRQSTNDSGSLPAVQGVAGARANSPPTVTTAPTAAAAAASAVTAVAASRTSETTNYEIGRTTTHTIAPPGQLARLSVAVVLDDDHTTAKDANGALTTTSKPRTPEELQRIQSLVAAAVGLDTERGDQITVENIAFGDQGLEEPALPVAWWPRLVDGTSNNALHLLRIGVVLVIGIVAVLVVLKPMARWALRLPRATVPAVAVLAADGTGARTVADLQNDIEAEIDAGIAAAGSEAARRLPALTRRMVKVADKEPEHLARLVRTLLAEGETT
jgi:flagellar M-ring protein FliF